MRLARSALPSVPADCTDDGTGFGGRAPSGIGLLIDAAGTGIHHRSLSSSESRSEMNATLVPSGETRGYVSLSLVSVSASGACHVSDPDTGTDTNRSYCRLGSPFLPAGGASRCANTIRPSAVHEGQRSSPAVVVTTMGPPVATPFFRVTTTMSKPVPRSIA